MKNRRDTLKREALWSRYWDIRHGKARGFYTPILWHLAFGHDYSAMAMLSDSYDIPGQASQYFTQLNLLYRADRGGYEYASKHLAMIAFNKRDLKGYRYWLRRHARFGDPEITRELKRFETRLPHAFAGNIGRRRPYRKGE